MATTRGAKATKRGKLKSLSAKGLTAKQAKGVKGGTGGAGAGKIKFNEFTIKKTTDSASQL